MIREQTLRARQKLVSKLPVSGELLRGSLLERTVRHTKDCPKCARGETRESSRLGVRDYRAERRHGWDPEFHGWSSASTKSRIRPMPGRTNELLRVVDRLSAFLRQTNHPTNQTFIHK